MLIEDVIQQPECVQIELYVAIADVELIHSSEKNWVNALVQSPVKYRILYEKLERFIINLLTSNLAEKGLSILLHSFANQRRSLHLNDNSETRLRVSDLQPQISTLVNYEQPQGTH